MQVNFINLAYSRSQFGIKRCKIQHFYGAFLAIMISWINPRSIVTNLNTENVWDQIACRAHVTRPQTQRMVCLWPHRLRACFVLSHSFTWEMSVHFLFLQFLIITHTQLLRKGKYRLFAAIHFLFFSFDILLNVKNLGENFLHSPPLHPLVRAFRRFFFLVTCVLLRCRNWEVVNRQRKIRIETQVKSRLINSYIVVFNKISVKKMYRCKKFQTTGAL